MAERRTSVTYQQWEAVEWPVSWSAIWVGGLAALATGLIFGLGGTALGAYSETRIVNWHKFQMWALVFSICTTSPSTPTPRTSFHSAQQSTHC